MKYPACTAHRLAAMKVGEKALFRGASTSIASAICKLRAEDKSQLPDSPLPSFGQERVLVVNPRTLETVALTEVSRYENGSV